MPAGMMPDHCLGNACAHPGGVDGDEPVHLAIERDVLNHLAAVGFQRAPEVM